MTNDWKAKMPRTAPKEGHHHVVVSRKRADGLRFEWVGQLPSAAAEHLTQHTIGLGNGKPAPAAGALTAADYEEVLADHRRLVRELDVLLNGAGAAQQASLSDIVKQVGAERDNPTPSHPDDLAVDRFAAAMKARLAQKREQGYSGWDDPEKFRVLDLQHLLQGTCLSATVDIGNYAMMLFNRETDPA